MGMVGVSFFGRMWKVDEKRGLRFCWNKMSHIKRKVEGLWTILIKYLAPDIK